ncbi:hypothetical protein AB0C42_15560 [Micromonospora taraxaci]|uniref:hypothetical protein n=1 Tax=Micromonospora TaxID=1873 RepID=UPI0033C4AF10
MFAQRLDGQSLASMARTLDDAGIPCPSGVGPDRNPHRSGDRCTLRTVAAILANLTLAAEHGLVGYEPGYHVVNPNAPGHAAPFTLSSESLPTMPDPDAHRLKWIIGQVGENNRYVILERADGWFVQVGYGDAAGVPAGTYALEYQEGSINRHFRCQTTDREAALQLLQEFRAGSDRWKRRHLWGPL